MAPACTSAAKQVANEKMNFHSPCEENNWNLKLLLGNINDWKE